MGGSTLERSPAGKVSVELARDATAPALARRALEAAGHALDREGEYYAKLLVSELVSNSVKYGGDGPVRVEAEATARGVHVEVIDCGPGFELEGRTRGLEDVGGWGLVLVDELASRWGKQPGSCRVWFEIDAPR